MSQVSLSQPSLQTELNRHNFQFLSTKLDLESIRSSLGIDRELIWAGLDWSGPDFKPGLDNRHLIIESHRGIRR